MKTFTLGKIHWAGTYNLCAVLSYISVELEWATPNSPAVSAQDGRNPLILPFLSLTLSLEGSCRAVGSGAIHHGLSSDYHTSPLGALRRTPNIWWMGGLETGLFYSVTFLFLPSRDQQPQITQVAVNFLFRGYKGF